MPDETPSPSFSSGSGEANRKPRRESRENLRFQEATSTASEIFDLSTFGYGVPSHIFLVDLSYLIEFAPRPLLR
jgi:hypothetical protein